MRKLDTTRLAAFAVALSVAVVASILGGCYHRVVGAEGPGSSSYTVYEPNLKVKKERRDDIGKWEKPYQD